MKLDLLVTLVGVFIFHALYLISTSANRAICHIKAKLRVMCNIKAKLTDQETAEVLKLEEIVPHIAEGK